MRSSSRYIASSDLLSTISFLKSYYISRNEALDAQDKVEAHVKTFQLQQIIIRSQMTSWRSRPEGRNRMQCDVTWLVRGGVVVKEESEEALCV